MVRLANPRNHCGRQPAFRQQVALPANYHRDKPGEYRQASAAKNATQIESGHFSQSFGWFTSGFEGTKRTRSFRFF